LIGFVLRRILLFIPMLFLMSVVSFLIILAPPGDFLNDYVAFLAEQGEEVTEEKLEWMRDKYGLNEPVYVQYFKWITGVIRWDLGRSLEYSRPVSELVNQRLLMTIILGVFTIAFTWTLAMPIGILSAVKQYSWMDYLFTFLSYFGVGTPNFLLALVIMWSAFAYFDLRITGLFSPEYMDADWSVGRVIDMLKHIWVPMIILGTDGTARFTRIVRANLLDEMSKPYVETARAKGLPEWKVVLKYPTRIALNPFISTAGWALPQLFSGSLIVAFVMNLPTLGPLLLQALLFQDMHMAGSMIMILTGLTLIGTLISDILLAWIDPRIRMEA
jgi:peptide/nickel transport system permease protein